MKKQKSIRSKLNIFILIIMFAVISSGCVFAVNIFFSLYQEEVSESVNMSCESLEREALTENENKIIESADIIKEIALGFLKGEKSSISLSDTLSYYSLDRLCYIKIYNEKAIYYISDRCKLNNINIYIESVPVVESYKDNLYLLLKEPVKDEKGVTEGTLEIGILISDKEYVEEIKEGTGLDATIFTEGYRSVTTIEKDGSQITGTILANEAYQKVFDEGKVYTGAVDILGLPYIVEYIPVVNIDGDTIGAFFSGKSFQVINEFKNKLIIYVTVLGIMLFAGFYIFIRRWMGKNIIEPLTFVADNLKCIANEEYTVVENMPEASSSEMETLQQSMKTMVSSIKMEKEKLETIAFTDGITNLPNRESLFKKYGDISLINNENTISILYYLDIDNMRYINHLFGQKVGDEIIQQVAEALKMFQLEYGDFHIFRITGDEFIICREGDYSMETVLDIAKRLLSVFQYNFNVSGYKISVTASIGIAYTNYCKADVCVECTGKCKDSIEILTKKAEVAMNKVKIAGKNNFALFDPEMNEEIQKKATMEQDLKQAIKNNEFQLYYQPKYNIIKEDYDGFEALIRWIHPKKGFISPVDFIPVAEETNIINDIGEIVIEKACKFIKEFNEGREDKFSVAVNVSAAQLLSDGFREFVIKAMELYGIDPKYIQLELTESVFVNSTEIVYEKLDFFRKNNILIALDDFGTGYSSITYLNNFPIDVLKIDKSFVDNIETDEVALQIIESIVKIGKCTGLKIVAEGVETKGQFEKLKRLECEYIQGYYFSKPLSEEDVYKML